MPSNRSATSSPTRAQRWLRSPGLCSIAAGALTACAFQPLALWPLAILGIGLLVWLTSGARGPMHAFLIGWLFGLGHFTLGNNWIAAAFTYQAEMPVWLGGIAVVLLSLYLAIFPGLATLLAYGAMRLADRLSAPTYRLHASTAASLAAAWILTEWMRAWLFTGFAWNPLGVVLLGPYGRPGLAVLAQWIGTYGLSGVLVLAAGLLAMAAERTLAPRNADVRLVWAGAGLVGVAMLCAGMLLIVPGPRKEGGVPYTLVQPDLRQETIDDPRRFEGNFTRLADLSLPRRAGQRRLVLWPESGLSDYLRDGYPPEYYYQFTFASDPQLSRRRIGKVIGPYAVLMTGGVDLVMDKGKVQAARNSVTMLDWRGTILAGYSKAHLVPYGEYLPLRWLLEPLGASRLVAGALDFWPGPGPRTYDLGAYGKAGVQICYEIVFSGEVVDPLNRPDYIFNPSNDGWFGRWGPPQHLAQARLRAIEEGLPVLRSTTTGISAVIDADGVVRAFVPRHQRGRLDGLIPPPRQPTFFAREGNVLPLGLALVLAIAALFPVALRWRRR